MGMSLTQTTPSFVWYYITDLCNYGYESNSRPHPVSCDITLLIYVIMGMSLTADHTHFHVIFFTELCNYGYESNSRPHPFLIKLDYWIIMLFSGVDTGNYLSEVMESNCKHILVMMEQSRFINLSIYFSNKSIHPSVVHSFIYPFIHLSIHLFIHSFICNYSGKTCLLRDSD